MSDNLADALNSLKKMVDSGNIPSEVQGIVNNLNNGNNNSNQSLNDMLSQISPEMLNNFSSMLQSQSNNSNSSGNTANSNNRISNNSTINSNNNFNIDPATLMKMTSMINAMNQKDNPGSNLLHSLKPYLRNSRKDKLDQYANLLNITKIADVMKNEKKENNHG